MKLKQTQKLSQRLTLTPQMKQSLRILQLPLLELKEYIAKETENNPVLEKETDNTQETVPLEKYCWENAPADNEYQTHHLKGYIDRIDEGKYYHQSLITKPLTLQEVLLQQLRMCKISREKYTIGEYIIYNIDNNGYLTLPAGEIALAINEENKLLKNINVRDVEETITLIHSLEPCGVGARNLKECLLIQLDSQGKSNTLAYEITSHYLPEVAKNKIRIVANKLKVRPDRIKKAIKEISRLNPKPGNICSYHQEVTVRPVYPDITVKKYKAGYEIIVNGSKLFAFRINSHYKNILKSNNISPETKKYILEKIKSALNLKKIISRREDTLRKFTQCLIHIQKDFFKQGDIDSLKPLTLKRIAGLISRNESTISRIVNKKYIDTPYGIFKLNYFFTKPITTASDSPLSRELVKTQVFNIITSESKENPLNDIAIANRLNKSGINISRRTVVKYRQELRIPPTSKRKICRM